MHGLLLCSSCLTASRREVVEEDSGEGVETEEMVDTGEGVVVVVDTGTGTPETDMMTSKCFYFHLYAAHENRTFLFSLATLWCVLIIWLSEVIPQLFEGIPLDCHVYLCLSFSTRIPRHLRINKDLFVFLAAEKEITMPGVIHTMPESAIPGILTPETPTESLMRDVPLQGRPVD